MFNNNILAPSCIKGKKRDDGSIAFQSPKGGLYAVRALKKEDYGKGYLNLLAQLTVVGDVTVEGFDRRFVEMTSAKGVYWIVVIEDETSQLIVGTATLFVEKKFVHALGKTGHIEDVVVLGEYRGNDLGKVLILELIAIAEATGCYKVFLDCSEKNIPFYEKCGLKKKEFQMVKYF